MDKAVQPAPAGKGVHYERRRPEDTALYQLVQEHLETFLAQVELETGSGLPDFVKEEFDAFLECGILAHGFLRLRCGNCGHEKLVAFSCKKRGFCPACGARRIAETAAHWSIASFPGYRCAGAVGTALTSRPPQSREARRTTAAIDRCWDRSSSDSC